jgi:LPS-assembly lipoprotein
MSSHKWKMPGIVRNRGLAALMVAGAILGASGCQVRPLYSDGAVNVGGAPTSTQAALSQIAIKPVKTRYGQEVRNHLIFLFGGRQA